MVLLAFLVGSWPWGFALGKGRAPEWSMLTPLWSQQTGCTAGMGSVCQCRYGARSQELAQPAPQQQWQSALALNPAASLSPGLLSLLAPAQALSSGEGYYGMGSLSVLRFLSPFILGISAHQKK